MDETLSETLESHHESEAMIRQNGQLPEEAIGNVYTLHSQSGLEMEMGPPR